MSIKKNSIYAFVGSALPLVIALVSVPLYIRVIGLERYGSLVTAWALLGYFGQADFGIGRAVAQRISSHRDAPGDAIAAVIWSGIVSMLLLGAVGAVLTLAASGYYFGDVMKVDVAVRDELMRSLWALALCNPVVTLTGVLSGALLGAERFKFMSFSYLVSNLGLQVLPLIVAATISQDLQWLIAASLAGRTLGLILMGTRVWQVFLAGQPVRPSWMEMRSLANFGAWVMASALIGPLMVFSDRFVIGAIYGALVVAVYTIPYQVAYRTLILPQSVVSALFPRFAGLAEHEALQLCRDCMVFVGQLFAPFLIGLICLSGPLLRLWLGSTLDLRSVDIAHIILLGVWFLALGQVSLAFHQARGNPRFVAVLSIVEIPFYIAILYLLGKGFGLVGFAWAFALRAAADALLLSMRARIADRTTLLHLAPTVVLLLLALLAGGFDGGWFAGIASATVLVGLCAIHLLFTLARMPAEVRQQFERLPLMGKLLGHSFFTSRLRRTA